MNFKIQASIFVLLITLLSLAYFGFYQPRKNKERALFEMQEVTRALDLYYQDCKHFPTAEQGLTALVEKHPDCEAWQGPYVERLKTQDPWGHAYSYQVEGDYYTLKSLGADGEPGGTGKNADLPEEPE